MIDPSRFEQYGLTEKQHIETHPLSLYDEDDETASATGTTLSTVAETADDRNAAMWPKAHTPLYTRFIEEMQDTQHNPSISRYQTTYFMDGGSRFISLPTLGNTNTKSASHISRLFEDWLGNKIYGHSSLVQDTLPILEDTVELLAEDILNKLKSRQAIRGMAGLSRVFVMVRTGHVYTYHQLEDGQPLLTEGMEDFFQQFPLFVEVVIYTEGRNGVQSSSSPAFCSAPSHSSPVDDQSIQLLLTVENATINPGNPYHIMEEIQI